MVRLFVLLIIHEMDHDKTSFPFKRRACLRSVGLCVCLATHQLMVVLSRLPQI